MSKGIIYWILMLIWLVFGIFGFFQPYPGLWFSYGNYLFLFILFLLLGWKVFGPPIQG